MFGRIAYKIDASVAPGELISTEQPLHLPMFIILL